MKSAVFLSTLSILGALALVPSVSADWPMWGGDLSNNMRATEPQGIPLDIEAGKRASGSEDIDMALTKNVLWVEKLGSQTYGTPTIAGGKVFVGTNNESPRDQSILGDRSAVMAFDEASGEFLYQISSPKLGAGKVSDWEFLGICSSPTIVGDEGFYVTNRCEILAFDVNGLGDGNDGMTNETGYKGGPDEAPIELTATDGDILWNYDMRGELGVFPHNVASSSVLPMGDKLFCTTSNGVDWTHLNVPQPGSPSLVVLDRATGEYLGELDAEEMSLILHCSWSSPAGATIDGEEMVFFAGGDGFCYGLGTEPVLAEGEDPEDPLALRFLPLKWKYDANPKDYREDADGNPIKYATYEGPSECISSPVVYKDMVYVLIGQDPEHGEGVGHLSCLDAKTGKPIWTSRELERSISTPSIVDDILYVADYTGRVFCFDALTGEKYWEFDTKGHIWGSTAVVDDHVYIANEEGELYVLATGKELKELSMVDFPGAIYTSPVFANGRMYLATMTHLYAFGEKKSAAAGGVPAAPAPAPVASLPSLGGNSFESGSARLTSAARGVLGKTAGFLRKNPGVRLAIGGHTDSSGSDELNLELSQKRADSVRDALIQEGIAGDRLTAKGYGESAPIASNDDEAGKAKNRRVELKVVQ